MQMRFERNYLGVLVQHLVGVNGLIVGVTLNADVGTITQDTDA
jgi:hypothetical protein